MGPVQVQGASARLAWSHPRAPTSALAAGRAYDCTPAGPS